MDYENFSNSAIVIGGSNGIGLAIAASLMEKGYFVYILDVVSADTLLDQCVGKYEYIYFDVRRPDYELLKRFKHDHKLKVLMITAGIGRVSALENLHPVEIQKTMEINTAPIQMLHFFYERIKSADSFLCGVMSIMPPPR